jgi:hypothetical protein
LSKITAFLKTSLESTAIEYGLIAAGDLGRDHCNGQRDWHQLERHNISTQLKLFLTSDNSVNGEGRV